MSAPKKPLTLTLTPFRVLRCAACGETLVIALANFEVYAACANRRCPSDGWRHARRLSTTAQAERDDDAPGEALVQFTPSESLR